MTRIPFETKGGQFSEAENLTRATEFLRQAADCIYAVGHNRKANNDPLADKFLMAAEKLEHSAKFLIRLGTMGRAQ